jgi:hypothetical protein
MPRTPHVEESGYAGIAFLISLLPADLLADVHPGLLRDDQVYLLRSLMEYARLFSPPPSSAP